MASSSSSKPSKKRKDRLEEQFFSCAGLPVSDSSLRQVLGRLEKDKSSTASSWWRKEDVRFKHQLPTILSEEVETKHGKVTMYATNLQKFFDQLQEKKPEFVDFLKRMMEPEMRSRPDGVDAIVYIDECVPGNILAPDNRRKSYCVYFTFKRLAQFRSIHIWFPVAVLRHSQTDKLGGGVAEFFTRTLRLLLPFLSGLVLGSETMIVAKTLFLIADEAALKACSAAKGAAGVRPCLHCDAFSSARVDMAELLGCQSITCPDFAGFNPITDHDILDILQHLKHIHQNQSKTALEEAQKLLGWSYNDSVCFLDRDLQEYLQPSRFHYDAMHCYWSNGQVNCELGLFFTAATKLAGLKREDVILFFSSQWNRTNASGLSTAGNLVDLVSTKLLKLDTDYKGSASQCLEVLPLLAFYALEVFQEVEALQPHIRSLCALWEVSAHILNAKQCIDAVHGLQTLQEKHLKLFIECYTKDCVRPKHHLAMHIQQQALDAGILLDCFPGERKNNIFKHTLAPRINRLEGFEKSILLRWLEHDAEKLDNFKSDQIVLRAQLSTSASEDVRAAKHVECIEGDILAGSMMLFDDKFAIQVIGCMQEPLG